MARPTNSSISASDAREWRRWLWRYAGCAAALTLLAAAALLAVDPYDTGRFALLPIRGVLDYGQRLTSASIARRPGVETAIIGNSTIQLLDPARLHSLTGEETVSLAIPGTGPPEQLAVADWFRRHHRGEPFQLVFGLDEIWCTTLRPIPVQHPFPFWLYSKSRLDYAFNLTRYHSIEAALRKLAVLLGKGHWARADGYQDYEAGRVWRAPDFGPPDTGAEPVAAPADFTAPPPLRRFLGRLPAGARVVLLFPPRYRSALPPPETPGALRLSNCKRAYQAMAAAFRGLAIIDFLADDIIDRDPRNFWDPIHYRGTVARLIEDRLAAALTAGKAAPVAGRN